MTKSIAILRRPAALATAAIVLAAAVLCLLTGVALGDLAVFIGFQLAFLLVPGVVVYRALASRPGGVLRHVCIGSAVGYALELLVFIVTAALDARGWFLGYPAAVLLLGAPVAWRRHGVPRTVAAGFSPRQAWALGAVGACALALFAAGSVSQAPLPDGEPSVSYYPDLVWGMSFAAEAKHHWPMTTPQVAGEPLHYHTFVFVHMAAVSQATGIELAAVVLRLVPLSMLLLLVVQLAYAGRHLTRRAWAGPLAAALLLLVGDLDLGAGRPAPFIGLFFSGLFLSPTQLLGLVVFVPAVVVVRDILELDARTARLGDLAILALLLFACAGAKASILPVLFGGLLLFALWRWWQGVSTGRLAGPVMLTGLALAGSYLLLYQGSRGASELGPLQSVLLVFPGSHFVGLAHEGLPWSLLAYPLATVVTVLALMLPLLGLVWVLRRGRDPLTVTGAWLLGLLLASLAAFFTLALPGVSQLYFLWYGVVAGAFLSAGGLVAALTDWKDRPKAAVRPLAVGAAAVAAIVLGADVDVPGLPLPIVYVALLVLLGTMLVAYALGLLDGRDWHPELALLIVAALLAAGALDGPLDRLPALAKRALDPSETVHRSPDPTSERGMTAGLARGLRWVREHTDSSAVLAVNNHLLIPARGDSLYFYYSALTERRVFLESWAYTDKAVSIGYKRGRAGYNPYPHRLSLNDSAFTSPSASGLARLRRRGVSHLLVDRLHGPTPPATPALGRPVYSSTALLVYPLHRARATSAIRSSP